MKNFNYSKRGRPQQNKHRINNDIKAKEVRLFGPDGILIGIKPIYDAMRMAELKNLDLVEIVPNSNPPVCKVIDYGKFLYELQKKEKTQKKIQTQQLLKEIRFKSRTDTHDFNFKVKHAREFIEDGNKVKASVHFRGREMMHTDIGKELLEKFIDSMKDIAKIDQNYKMDKKNMTVILSPIKGLKKQKTNVEEVIPEKEKSSVSYL